MFLSHTVANQVENFVEKSTLGLLSIRADEGAAGFYFRALMTLAVLSTILVGLVFIAWGVPTTVGVYAPIIAMIPALITVFCFYLLLFPAAFVANAVISGLTLAVFRLWAMSLLGVLEFGFLGAVLPHWGEIPHFMLWVFVGVFFALAVITRGTAFVVAPIIGGLLVLVQLFLGPVGQAYSIKYGAERQMAAEELACPYDSSFSPNCQQAIGRTYEREHPPRNLTLQFYSLGPQNAQTIPMVRSVKAGFAGDVISTFQLSGARACMQYQPQPGGQYINYKHADGSPNEQFQISGVDGPVTIWFIPC